MSVLSTIIFFMILLVSLAGNIVLGYYLYKFTRIIMTFEDDIADALEALQTVDETMGKLDDIKMFYEDDTIKNLVSEVIDRVRIARHYVNWMAKRFTDRSKQRYITVEPSEEDIERMLLESQRSPEKDEGTVLHVSH